MVSATVSGDAQAPLPLGEALRFTQGFWRRRPDLNRGWRFCRPLPYHLATAPVGTELYEDIPPRSGAATTTELEGGCGAHDVVCPAWPGTESIEGPCRDDGRARCASKFGAGN